MQAHELLHVLHVLVHGKLHALEDAWNHLFAYEVVIVESPADFFIVALGEGLGDVVKQSSPSEPHLVAFGSHVLKYLHGVEEVVLVSATLHRLHPTQGSKLGEDDRQKTTLIEQHEATRGVLGSHNLHQLVGDALPRDNLYALAVTSQSLKCFGEYVEVELSGKAHCTHHSERVVAESDVGVERSAYDAAFHVAYSVEGVKQLTVAFGVHADSHSIDGEVAAALVVVERAVFYDRFTAVAVVGLTPCTHKLQFDTTAFHLGSAEVAEDGERSALAEGFSHSFSHFDATAHGHEVDVLRWSVQKDVAHIAAYHIAFAVHCVGRTSYDVEYFVVEVFVYQVLHSFIERIATLA